MTKVLLALTSLAVVALATTWLVHRSMPTGATAAPADGAGVPAQANPQAPRIKQLKDFPRDSLTIESGDRRHEFGVWMADTAARRSQGLMFVKDLPKSNGMLFLFGEPQGVSMWMKNTLIPLDMLFIAADGRVARIAQRTEPGSLTTIESGSEVTAVLELGGGECERLGIKVGDYLRHPAFTAQ